jgi:sulfide:quinone oxidoreductase
MEKSHEKDGIFVHVLDHKERVNRNFWNGWNNTNGDMICYSPKFPYKGEGTDFYALYYEHFMRQDKLQGRAAANARIQFWTPNKEIYQFSYANEVALDECHKRGIDVMLGWEMLEVKKDEHNQKIAIFQNVDTKEIIEKPFNTACINPPSKPHKFLSDAGLTNSWGGIDVNKYTLQHKKYENIFAFGDAVGFETTRTQSAAMN